MNDLSESIIDRAVGAILGSAAGDALGAGYEFTNPALDQEIAMVGGGGFGWAPGEWTDDTQMAVAILDVIASGSSDLDAIASNFLAWYAAGPADVGIQTSSVLGDADEAEDLAGAAAEFMDANPRSAGNGALMRTAPVALTALDDRTEIARLAGSIASLTHAHADSNAYACTTDANANPYGHADSNAYSNGYTHANSHANIHAGSNNHANADAHAYPNRDASTDAHTDPDSDLGARADAYSYADTNPDGNTCSYPHGHACANHHACAQLQVNHQ